MEFKTPRNYSQPEKKIETDLREYLHQEGWVTEKLHGSAYQAGFPDLYCYHPEHGERWVEVKTESGSLTHAQYVKFSKWEAFNLGVWILMGVHEYKKLFYKPNWRRLAGRVKKPKFNNPEWDNVIRKTKGS